MLDIHFWNNRRQALWSLVLFFVGIHFTLAFLEAYSKSPTADEYSYIASSYFYAKDCDFRLDRTHPPLLRLMMGFPLLFLDIKLPELHENQWNSNDSYFLGYRIGWNMLLDGSNNRRTMLLTARLPVILLSCALAFLLFIWASELYGAWGGLFSLFFYCFCPNMLAHGGLATMDAGLCFFYILTLFFFYQFTRIPVAGNLVAAGFALGMALAAKVTALLLCPVLFLALVIHNQKNKNPWLVLLKNNVILFGCAIGFLLLLYGYPLRPFYYFDTLKNVFFKSLHTGNAGMDIPGMPHLNYAFYLMGNYSTSGWPYYYLAALLFKTPLPVLILLFLLLFLHIHSYWTKKNPDSPASKPADKYYIPDILILGSIGFLLFASVFNRVNIGIRHILPVYPLLYLYFGRIPTLLNPLLDTKVSRWASKLIYAAMVWLAITTIWVSPDYLTYFNELCGGPSRGQYYLDDSNLDWGQDLSNLSAIQKQYPDQDFYVATNWYFNAKAFGLNAKLFDKKQIANPPKGIVAVGKHWAVRNRINRNSPDYFDWFEKYKPIAEAGHSMLIYKFE